MKILVTGFDPFGGETTNPAYEAVKLLPDEILGASIKKLEIPTEFDKSIEKVKKQIEEDRPDAVINVGQAGGRTCISIEKVAINLAEALIPDNAGKEPHDEPLEDGPDAYFSTLPVRKIAEKIKAHNIPCDISYSAGTYVCNSIMYRVLHLAATQYPDMQAGFIHVPFSNEQAAKKTRNVASMPLTMIAEAIVCAIEAVVIDMYQKAFLKEQL